MERCPPTTETQKQSCGDLHSRLKTRKLLGVGTTEDGDVHRSKLSQILGHSEQLHIRIPRGLRPWQWTLSILFFIIGVSVLTLPGVTFELLLGISLAHECSLIPARLFGAALLGLAATNWACTESMDKDIVRWTMISNIAYFAVQLGVILLSHIHRTDASKIIAVICIIFHTFAIAMGSYFYWSMGSRHHTFRTRSSVDLKSFRNAVSGLTNSDVSRKDS